RIETTPLPLLLDAVKARGRRRREICYIFLMVSLTPSQSSRLVSCFALTKSVSLNLVPSKLEKTRGLCSGFQDHRNCILHRGLPKKLYKVHLSPPSLL
ncbi:unnamed protein product, partial [Brassica oleracea]